MRILIIGGTSFIGPPLVRRLVGLGHEVAVFHRGRTRADLPAGVEHIVGDRHDLGGKPTKLVGMRPEAVVDMIAYTEAVTPREGLERTIAWERADPAGSAPGIGLLDYDAEDAILAEAGHN